MIDDYMPIRLDLPDDEAVLAIAGALNLDPDTVVGKLVRVWAWAQKNSTDGRMKVGKSSVDFLARCAGLADAMEHEQWLSTARNGCVVIPKWEKWNSKAAKVRAAERDRKRTSAGKKSEEVPPKNGKAPDREEQEQEQEEIQEELEEEKERHVSSGLASAKPCASSDARRDRAADIRAVFAHYRTYHQKAFPAPNSKMAEWRKIAGRLQDGYSVADLCRAIDGNHRSPFHRGENERGKQYHSLELIVRNADKVSQFIEIANDSRPVLSEKTQRTKRAADSYLEKRFAEMEADDGVLEG